MRQGSPDQSSFLACPLVSDGGPLNKQSRRAFALPEGMGALDCDFFEHLSAGKNNPGRNLSWALPTA